MNRPPLIAAVTTATVVSVSVQRLDAVSILSTPPGGTPTQLSLAWAPCGPGVFEASIAPSPEPLTLVAGRAGLQPAAWEPLLGADLRYINSVAFSVTPSPLSVADRLRLSDLSLPLSITPSDRGICTGNETGSLVLESAASDQPRVITVAMRVVGLPADLNADDGVGTPDLLLLVGAFPATPTDDGPIQPVPCVITVDIGGGGQTLHASPDITRDGRVDMEDLIALLQTFGSTAGP